MSYSQENMSFRKTLPEHPIRFTTRTVAIVAGLVLLGRSLRFQDPPAPCRSPL